MTIENYNNTVNLRPLISIISVTNNGNSHIPIRNFTKSHKLHRQGSTFCLPRVILQSVVTALALSNLDYCNAIMSGATAFQLGCLQRLQNRAARLITGVGIRDHITPVPKELH